MRIIFTKHAEKKFGFLKELGFNIKRGFVEESLKNPSKIQKGYSGTKVILKKIDETHNLRIVYSDEGGIITVITFYPVRKDRYD